LRSISVTEHEVCGRAAGFHGARHLEADDLRDEQRNGLAQHRGLRLDATHAPAQHTQAVDHGGVRVRAHDGVRVHLVLALGVVVEHHAAEIFEVHLVDDAGVGRHHLEIVERGLAPAQEGVALAITLELDPVVRGQRTGAPVVVHLHRMVDDQLGGVDRVDLLRIAA
jgi:hypothetical protein